MGSITGSTNGSSSDKGLIEPINITMSVTSSISKDGNLNNLTILHVILVKLIPPLKTNVNIIK